MRNHQPLLGRLAAKWFNEVIAAENSNALKFDQSSFEEGH